MQDGSFYCYVARGQNVSSWLPFAKGAGSEKAVLKQLGSFNERDGIISPSPMRTHSSRSWNNKRSLSAADSGMEGQNQNQILVPGAGISAQYGWVEVAGELYRMQPTVHATKDAAIVMYGYLFSTEALQHSPMALVGSVWGQLGEGTPRRAPHSPIDMAGSLEDNGGLCDNDGGSHTAQVLLEHILHVTRSKGTLQDALVDVKGCYSFLVYDSEKRTAYASREDNGEDKLYFFLDEDGCAHFSNQPLDLTGQHAGAGWQELEPGASLTVKVPTKHKSKPKVDLFCIRNDKKPAGAMVAALPGPHAHFSSSSDDCEDQVEVVEEGNLELFNLEA